MKRITYIILSVILLAFFTGCNNADVKDTTVNDSLGTIDTIQADDAARIVVNGKEITNGQYYRYKYCGEQSEVPLLAVLSELGASVKWKNQTKVKVRYSDMTEYFDTSEITFNIFAPPGTNNMTREVREKELVVDSKSAKRVISRLTGATMSFDDETRTIEIKSPENTVKQQGNTRDGTVCSDENNE